MIEYYRQNDNQSIYWFIMKTGLQYNNKKYNFLPKILNLIFMKKFYWKKRTQLSMNINKQLFLSHPYTLNILLGFLRFFHMIYLIIYVPSSFVRYLQVETQTMCLCALINIIPILIFSQKHQYFIELVMRLRHKKPLNPYKGQTNNDKSEFNDDDFNQQTSPLKRVGKRYMQAANGTTDQIYKYARILTKFIDTINQDYRTFETQNVRIRKIQPKGREFDPFNNESDNQREYTPFKSEQNNQRKQRVRLQTKKQMKQAKKVVKMQPKKKDNSQTYPKFQENKNKPLENSITNSLEMNKNNQTPKNSAEIQQKNEKKENLIRKQAEQSAAKTMQQGIDQKINPNVQSFKSNQNPPLNPTDFQNNVQAYLNYSALLGQNSIFSNLYSMQMGQMPMRYPPLDNMAQNYLPNMQLGLNMKFLGMGMNNQLMVQQSQQQQFIRPCQNLFAEQVKAYNNNKPTTIVSNPKEAYPLKRAAYHVAIAYKIYLDKLKKDGQNFQNLEEIDPTRYAKRIKNSQSNGKSKDNSKKRK